MVASILTAIPSGIPTRLREGTAIVTIMKPDTLVRVHESGPKIKASGYAAKHSFSNLTRFEFERSAAVDSEIEIEVLFCGLCHSDIHQVKNEWKNTVYPCMPGHEVVGRVTKLGPKASKYSVGDLVGVGCMIDSCGQCGPCKAGDQNYCESSNSWLATYNGPMVPSSMAPGMQNIYGVDNTFGGYSSVVVVKEEFVLRIPPALRPEVAAPILCAGVTTYSPMKRWKVTSGHHVGIIGFGGLGNMAAKLATAMGAKVTIFTRTEEKLHECATLGFAGVLESDKKAMSALKSTFDFMLSTVPEKHDINPFVKMLKRDSTLVVVGCLAPLEPVNNMEVAMHRKAVAGSLIGNLNDTQEVLDFCAEHGIGPDIEMISVDELNDAYDKVEKGDVRFRYVIDLASLKAGSSV